MKALVTGGAGFIGSHIADMLLEKGCSVAVIDDLSTGNRSNLNSRATFYEKDIEAAGVGEIFAEEKPDVVFHTAAQISVSRSVREPVEDARINIIGSIKLLEHCVSAGVKKIVFSSSGGTVYGEVPGEPAAEDAPFNPFSPYGIGKMCFEFYLAFFHNQHGLNYTVLRYGNVYGPRQDPHGEAGVVAIFTRAMLEGRTPTINGDGKYYRDYVFVEDVARANLACIEKGDGRVFNVGTGTLTDVVQIFGHLKKATGFDKPADFGPHRPGDLRRSLLNIERAEKELGWTPQVPMDEGMRKTVEFFRARMSG